jgi:hypothetical protein
VNPISLDLLKRLQARQALQQQQAPAPAAPPPAVPPQPALDYGETLTRPFTPAQAGAPPLQHDNPLYGELGTLPRNDAEGISSEISIGVDDPRLNGGRPTNIPTLVRGQKGVREMLHTPVAKIDFTPEQREIAIQRAIERQKAGGELKSYPNWKAADDESIRRSHGKGMAVGKAMRDQGVPDSQYAQFATSPEGSKILQQTPNNQLDPSVIQALYGTSATPPPATAHAPPWLLAALAKSRGQQ